MKYADVGDVRLPAVAVGCMGLNRLDVQGACAFISAALDAGLNFFDHADIYGGGACERLFGDACARLGIGRDAVVLQSKCGIVPGKMYDLSAAHIRRAVEGSLRRLRTDRLDFLLLHRPDALMQPEEVAAAFDALERAGMVLHFGVSNMHPYQIELLKSAVRQPLCVDQLQFSPVHAGMISCGTEVNMETAGAPARDGYVLDYCRLHGMAVQAWSPLRYGFFEGVFLENAKFGPLNEALAGIAAKYGVQKSAAVAAWILRHPAKMQVVTGTASIEHLKEIAAGADIALTREEWYAVYIAAGHLLP